MPPAAGVDRLYRQPLSFFFNTLETRHGCFSILPLQGRQADASETCGAAIQWLGSGPRRRTGQQRHSGQRSKLLHGECRPRRAPSAAGVCFSSRFLRPLRTSPRSTPRMASRLQQQTQVGTGTAADTSTSAHGASQIKKLIWMSERPEITVAEERKVKVTSDGSFCCKHGSLNHLRITFF